MSAVYRSRITPIPTANRINGRPASSEPHLWTVASPTEPGVGHAAAVDHADDMRVAQWTTWTVWTAWTTQQPPVHVVHRVHVVHGGCHRPWRALPNLLVNRKEIYTRSPWRVAAYPPVRTSHTHPETAHIKMADSRSCPPSLFLVVTISWFELEADRRSFQETGRAGEYQ